MDTESDTRIFGNNTPNVKWGMVIPVLTRDNPSKLLAFNDRENLKNELVSSSRSTPTQNFALWLLSYFFTITIIKTYSYRPFILRKCYRFADIWCIKRFHVYEKRLVQERFGARARHSSIWHYVGVHRVAVGRVDAGGELHGVLWRLLEPVDKNSSSVNPLILRSIRSKCTLCRVILSTIYFDKVYSIKFYWNIFIMKGWKFLTLRYNNVHYKRSIFHLLTCTM